MKNAKKASTTGVHYSLAQRLNSIKSVLDLAPGKDMVFDPTLNSQFENEIGWLRRVDEIGETNVANLLNCEAAGELWGAMSHCAKRFVQLTQESIHNSNEGILMALGSPTR